MNRRSILSVLFALAMVPAASACSHDDDTHHDHGQATASTSGDEHTQGHDRVVARDTDHDGTHDTVAVQEGPPTAMDQGEGSADLEITRQIRSAVVSDSSLSFGARNCTIITNNAVVVLRGDVTQAENDAILRHAQHVAGITRVDNMLNVTDATAPGH